MFALKKTFWEYGPYALAVRKMVVNFYYLKVVFLCLSETNSCISKEHGHTVAWFSPVYHCSIGASSLHLAPHHEGTRLMLKAHKANTVGFQLWAKMKSPMALGDHFQAPSSWHHLFQLDLNQLWSHLSPKLWFTPKRS